MAARYFIYARKSTEGRDRQVQSIPDQVKRMNELAHNRLAVIDTYREAKSAKAVGTRPIFIEMIQRIEKGEADGILCWHLNRLYRNSGDFSIVHGLLQRGTIKSIITPEKEYKPDESPLILYLEAGIADQYLFELRKSTVRGMKSKLLKGWYPAAAPVGYLNVGNKGDATIIPDSERFAMVRQMFDMMLTGIYTPPQILKIANNDWGFRTKKRKKSGGKELSRSSIYLMFTNIFYAGRMVFGKEEYQGSHKAMITEAEYDRVQMLLGRKGKPRPKKHKFAYTGFIRCGECDCLITAETKRKIIKGTGEQRMYTYYHCTRKRRDVKCSQKTNIREEMLEKMIVELLGRYTILPEFRDWALDVLRENHAVEVEERSKIYETQQRRIVTAQKELDKLMDLRLRDLINDEEFIAKRDNLKREIAHLQTALRETEDRAEKWVELAEKGFNFATYARKAFMNGDMETKKTILMALGQNPIIKDGTLSLRTNEWLQPIAESYSALEKEYKKLEPSQLVGNEARTEALTSVRESWRPHRDSNPGFQIENLKS